MSRTYDRFVPLFVIPRPLVEASNGHERMSEVGERATTAECRFVGLFALQNSTVQNAIDPLNKQIPVAPD